MPGDKDRDTDRSPHIVIPAPGQIHVFNLGSDEATRLRNVRFAWNLREGRAEHLEVKDGATWRDPDAGERDRLLDILALCLMLDIEDLGEAGFALVHQGPADWDAHETKAPEVPGPVSETPQP